MGNMLTATVAITGVRPLLWHHFGPEVIPATGKRERTGVAGNDPTEWKRTVLMTAERQLYLESTAVFGCLRDAARFTRKGRGSIQATLVATLDVLDERILVDRVVPPEPLPTDSNAPVFLHVTSVRNPVTKGRNIRYRVAAATGWQLAFNLCWDKTVISRGELEAVLIDAGRLVGLGNGRSIGFGRFMIRELTVVEA
jgi:hypothetical protein